MAVYLGNELVLANGVGGTSLANGHATTHAKGGSDELAPADIGAAEEVHTHTEYALKPVSMVVELPLDGCAGKLVSGFAWRYVGLCSAKEGEKLLGDNGKPLTRSVKIKFPGQMETPLKASVSEVAIDEATGLARFVITCEIINGDVLRLNRASAQIIVDETTGLRVPIDAIHYLKEDGTESETQGENYIPGVYVKYGNLARFCKIDPVDNDHPLVTDGEYRIVMPSSSDKTKTVSEVRLYDEIIVSGQNLYDGKLL